MTLAGKVQNGKKQGNRNLFDIPVMYIIKKTVKYHPLYVAIITLQLILNALIPSLQAIIVADFINSAIDIVNSGTDISKIYGSVTGIITTLGFKILSEKLVYFVKVKLVNKIRLQLGEELMEKYAKLSYKHLEDSEIADLIERMLKTPEIQLMDAYLNVVNCISLVVTIGSIMVIIISQVWWAGVLITICAVPLSYFAIKSGKTNYEMSRETTKYIRKYNYIGEVLTSRESVDERTLFGFSNNLQEIWGDNYETARKMIFRTELKWWAKMKLSGLLTVVISLVITLALLSPVTMGIMSTGMFISLINITYSLVNTMCDDLTNTMDKLASSTEYIADLKRFYALSETSGAIALPSNKKIEFEKLEFKNVRFKYPQTEKYILDGMSFTIEKGKHYSFVGLNGAGKTTVIKLITGLYQDFEGQILINNKYIQDYNQSEIKALCAVAYQDFAKYAISVKDNLLLGNITKMNSGELNLKNAMSMVDLEQIIEKLPNGMDTNLGKIKRDGVDLSGGQWQRVALARFILNDAPLKILDEPTSALDPINESNMYEKFDMICKYQTTIFISHRLGSTKIADEIFVINRGKIAEYGRHQDLMTLKGLYYDLYESQRSWYK